MLSTRNILEDMTEGIYLFSMPEKTLFALPAQEAEACLAQLKQAIPNAAIIGYVTEKEDPYIILE